MNSLKIVEILEEIIYIFGGERTKPPKNDYTRLSGYTVPSLTRDS